MTKSWFRGSVRRFPCNTTFVEFATNPKFHFVAGMNFPMVLTAILSSESVENLIAQDARHR
ncbi:MAG: hypothetical protein ACLSA6_05590 [Holdemania massiliensis]